MLADINAVQDIVIPTMGGLVDALQGTPQIEQSINQALAELNWALPMDDVQKEYWIIERSKRFVLYSLLFESAKKFRFKQIFLQQRFDNYFRLLQKMDDDLLAAIENNPDLFDVAGFPSDKLFSYITTGFTYDGLGRDTTYKGWE